MRDMNKVENGKPRKEGCKQIAKMSMIRWSFIRHYMHTNYRVITYSNIVGTSLCEEASMQGCRMECVKVLGLMHILFGIQHQ